jgi:radical SAM superfamily enzyme YgiQ (UPF0313 family)
VRPPKAIPVYPFHPPPLQATGVVRQSEDDDGFYLPLALGLIVEAVRNDPEVGPLFDFEIPVIFSEAQLLEAIERRGPGVCLFSSYVWNSVANLAGSRAAKLADARCLTLHGGPSTPKHPEVVARFLGEQPHVDVAVRGEGERIVRALFARIAQAFDEGAEARASALADVPGLTLRTPGGEVVRTPDAARIDELGDVVSPYVTGYFDRVLDARVKGGRGSQLVMATLETNRGCPYQCTFCDWGSLTLQKIRSFPIERVRAELEWIGRHGIHAIFMGDANFGMLARDLEIAEVIADVRQRLGAPREVVANYAKNGSEQLAKIFACWQRADVAFEPTISIQTQDAPTLQAIRRSNIKRERYLELSEVYRSMRLRSRIHLMMGLPGQTLASWKDDLQFVFQRQEEAQIFPTRMLPNSPMADPAYVAEHRLRIDDSDTIVESATFTEAEWREMGRLTCAYLIHQNWAILRYLLMYLQWDHGLRAADVIHAHTEAIAAHPEAYPEATALLGALLVVPPAQLCGASVATFARFHSGGWRPLLEELAAFVEATYAVPRLQAFDAVLQAQEAVLPRAGAPTGRTITLGHDVAAYVRDGCAAMLRGDAPARRLEAYDAGTLAIKDTLRRNGKFEPLRLRAVTGGDPGWELGSALLEATCGFS